MLYRHFPKISNRQISILALSLTGATDDVLAAALIRRATGLGINLVDAGSDPARIARLAEIASSAAVPAAGTAPVYRLYEFAGEGFTAKQLDALIDGVGGCENDFLSIRIPDAGFLAKLGESGVPDLALDAKRNGRCGLIGFSCPSDSALIKGICGDFGDWDFFRTDFSFLDTALLPAIRHAASLEIGFIASNPFAGGYLEKAPPAVHDLYYRAPVPRSHAEWALRGIWEMQETVSVVVTPKNPDDLTESAIFAEAGRPNSLTGRELDVLAAAGKVAGKSSANP